MAHRTLQLNSLVRVTDIGNGGAVVRTPDCGPLTRHRLIDLSRAATDEAGVDFLTIGQYLQRWATGTATRVWLLGRDARRRAQKQRHDRKTTMLGKRAA